MSIINLFFQGNHSSRKEVFEENTNGEKAEQNNKRENLTTDSNDFHWNLGIKFKLPESSLERKEFLEKLIKTKIAKEKRLSQQFEFSVVLVEKSDLTGLYWFPFVKNGKSAYKISVENKFYNDSYSANFVGDFDFQVYGFSTIDNLEKSNADKIAKIVVDSIKNDYK